MTPDPALSSPVHPIQVAWKAFAGHALSCSTCQESAIQLRDIPDDPAAADAHLHDRLCPCGQTLHITWTQAKAAWLETTIDFRRRIGILGAAPAACDLRDAAWLRVPETDRPRILELPEAERERQLEAIEAAILSERRGIRRTICSSCGAAFQARRPSDRYCSAACRAAAAGLPNQA